MALLDKMLGQLSFDHSKTYYPHKYYYQHLSDSYSNLSRYSGSFNNYPKPSVESKKNISLIDGEHFGLSHKTICKRFGKPRAKFKILEEGFDLEVMIYKIFLGRYPVRLELHLNHSVLFYFKYTFSSGIKSPVDINEILQIIQGKYLNNEPVDLLSLDIIDEKRILLQVDNKVNFKIKYLDTRSDTLVALNRYKAKKERHKANKLKAEVKSLTAYL
jgi:hypothetical protein